MMREKPHLIPFYPDLLEQQNNDWYIKVFTLKCSNIICKCNLINSFDTATSSSFIGIYSVRTYLNFLIKTQLIYLLYWWEHILTF